MPDRADVLALLDRFYTVDLVPSISYNGSVPGADIEVTHGPRVQGQASAPILDVQITAAGLARLEAAK